MKIYAKSVVLLSTLAFGSASFASNDNHHHDNSFDFDKYQEILKGQDLVGQACYLGIANSGINEEGAYTAEVESSFAHDGEGPGTYLITIVPGSDQIVAVNDRGRLVINLNSQAETITSALEYAVSWQHEGHSDSGLCRELAVYQHDDDHGDGEFDPNAFDLVLQGQDLTGEACFLGMNNLVTNNFGVMSATVETSFAHDGEGPGSFLVQLDPNASRLISENDRGQISIELDPAAKDLVAAFRYATIWEHEGHNDSGVCLQLRPLVNP